LKFANADKLVREVENEVKQIVNAPFTQPARGTVTRGENNTLVYLSIKDFVGVDTFLYTISDGRGGIAGTTVTVYADP